MPRIAHLSDLHFGRHDPKVVDGSRAWLEEHRPDLVIISGDFTQRARVEQFRLASAFLNRLRAAGFRVLAVPGNHDVPLYDVGRRFPGRCIATSASSTMCSAPGSRTTRLAVLGINTARSLTISNGRINRDQLDLIAEFFAAVPPHKTRVLVTHHPFSRCRSAKAAN